MTVRMFTKFLMLIAFATLAGYNAWLAYKGWRAGARLRAFFAALTSGVLFAAAWHRWEYLL